MKYFYYPGCSLSGTAREYDLSTRALFKSLNIPLLEIQDWTCCGATAAEATSYLLSLVLPARILALAEQMDGSGDVLVPCSACYLNLKKVEQTLKKAPDLLKKVNIVLKENEIEFNNRIKVRHLLDVLTTDIDLSVITSGIQKKLSGIKIAPYYGCQCLRPYPVFDDPESPVSMEPLIKATGATVHLWNMGGKCCGASQMTTKPEIAIAHVAEILNNADDADAIVTVCPMCQMNLEAYQKECAKFLNKKVEITIIYLPQLIGLAFGISEKDLGLNYNLSVTREFKKRLN